MAQHRADGIAHKKPMSQHKADDTAKYKRRRSQADDTAQADVTAQSWYCVKPMSQHKAVVTHKADGTAQSRRYGIAVVTAQNRVHM